MTTKVRNGVFETNSSSVHVLGIAKNVPMEELELPKSFYFDLGSFGWENDTISTYAGKGRYLHTMAFVHWDQFEKNNTEANEAYEEWKNGVTAILNAHGVNEVEFKELEPNERWYDYYIDHCEYDDDCINKFATDSEYLINFLFNDKSQVVTGNDNNFDGGAPDESDLPNECEIIYYKGN